MLLRVRAHDGTRRVEVTPDNTTANLFSAIAKISGLSEFRLYFKPDKSEEILPSGKSISNCGLGHGDMIFLSSVGSVPTPPVKESSTVDIKDTLDDVDKRLKECSGRIDRKRDPKTCRHGHNSACVHCLPIEPYDAAYLEGRKIKHMSFHAYMRKLCSGVDKGKFVNLENDSCRIKPGCSKHLPYPRGVCSTCQPKAITLNRQSYRHVDHVIFENAMLVDRFLNFWRITGTQRIGFLYGRYERHLDVPLGIKAVVAAIYEPPQESTRDSVKLLADPRQKAVDEIADKLGLRCVGWVFTDLLSEDASKGTVRHTRGANSHFLSAQECIMAGHFQSLHPNPCQMASSGNFGSKFVTVCVTGNSQNQIHMEGYQVSNQCQALVLDQCLVPTQEAPELAYVRKSSLESYVADVYYKEKDSYGNEVTRIARPLPVEYLLLDVPASTPLNPLFTFHNGNQLAFPVENRPLNGHLQDMSSLDSYLKQFTADRFIEASSDFHFLVYIATMDEFPMMEFMNPLLEAIKTENAVLAEEWTRNEPWLRVTRNNVAATNSWACQFCTFINPIHLTSCEMCSLPNQTAG